MLSRDDITPGVIREFLDYNPETGSLTWKHRDVKWFCENRPDWSSRKWNTRYAGKPAFNSKASNGYFFGWIHKHAFGAHRVAFAHFHGEWPPCEVDHIDGNRRNNAIVNLRSVDRVTNRRNMRLHKRNTSGVCGVSWNKHQQKWVAHCGFLGVANHLGTFDSFEGAVAARKAKEAELGFHENHGVLRPVFI